MHAIRIHIAIIAIAMPLALAACDEKKDGDEDSDAGSDAVDTTGDDGTGDPEPDAEPDTDEDTAPDVPEDTTPDVPEDTTPDVPEDTALDFEWDAPEIPDRYGVVQFGQISGATGTFAFGGLQFGDYSAVTAERPLWADENCSVTVYHDPPTPTAGFVMLSAGTPFTMTGGGGTHSPVECTYDASTGYDCGIPETAGVTIFGTTDTVTMTAPGDEVVGFTFDMDSPPATTVTSSSNISRGSGYTVEWSEVDADAVMISIITGDYFTNLDGGTMIECIVDTSLDPAPTSFDVPLTALSLLSNTSMSPTEFIVGVIQLTAVNFREETLSDDTVVNLMLANGQGVQINVSD